MSDCGVPGGSGFEHEHIRASKQSGTPQEVAVAGNLADVIAVRWTGGTSNYQYICRMYHRESPEEGLAVWGALRGFAAANAARRHKLACGGAGGRCGRAVITYGISIVTTVHWERQCRPPLARSGPLYAVGLALRPPSVRRAAYIKS